MSIFLNTTKYYLVLLFSLLSGFSHYHTILMKELSLKKCINVFGLLVPSRNDILWKFNHTRVQM